MGRILVTLAAALTCVSGCGPRASWVRNPGPDDDGLRYYRPKPYILVAPALIASESEHAKSLDSNTQVAAYKISLCYLPDFGEEYSVHIHPGLGASKLSVTLENGWNLTSINQDLDSKTSDNVNAAAGLVKALTPGGLYTPPAATARDINGKEKVPAAIPDAFVFGHEVPIGYYEAVVGRSPHDGAKRLLGFRYVGFLPFASGPVDTTAAATACCADGSETLYGLVLEKGVLIFNPLSELAISSSIPALASAKPEHSVGSSDSQAKPPTLAVKTELHEPRPQTKPQGLPSEKPAPTPEATPSRIGSLVPINP